MPDVRDRPFPAAWGFDGFQDVRLNKVFTLSWQISIARRPTYWDSSGQYFLYYADSEQRWAICPAFQRGENLLHDVQAGRNRGLAFEEDGLGIWSEYSEMEKAWTTRQLTLTRCTGHSLPSEGGRLAQRVLPSVDSNGKTAKVDLVERRLVAYRVPTPRKFLEENPQVQEILLVRGPLTAKLLVRTRAATGAGAAVDVGRRLLPVCKVDTIRPIGATQFCNLRGESRQCKRRSLVGGAEDVMFDLHRAVANGAQSATSPTSHLAPVRGMESEAAALKDPLSWKVAEKGAKPKRKVAGEAHTAPAGKRQR